MRNIIYLLLPALLLTAGCRHDELVYPSENEMVDPSAAGKGGMYLLNEGNMGSNKCTLDFYDFATGDYHRNIYAERNPSEAMELGDVGNDIAVYGSKLYIVVNCSHKMEVLDAATGVKIGKVDIPNCRYVKFYGAHAYVSSYIGPVGADPDCPLGAVFKVDTASLSIVGKVAVGYQPEEMETVGNMLYVVNSGGYRPPEYDNTISAINLDTFTVDHTIEAAPNMLRLRKDRYDRLWATSRGNHADKPSRILMLEPKGGRYALSKTFPYAADNIALRGDSLLFISSEGGNSYGAIDVGTGRFLGSFISDGTDAGITRPYGLAVDPAGGDIYLTDAKNFVSSGTLYAFDGLGRKKWSVRTGDIPVAMAFAKDNVAGGDGGIATPPEDLSAYISTVYEYSPAPGQYINSTPAWEPGATKEDMARKCEEWIGGTAEKCISLGGFGGYVVFGFDHLVENVEGEYDFRIWGNTVWQSEEIRGGSAEPGIVYVSYDANGNGIPDDEWYELAGSEYGSETTLKNYSVTYHKPLDDASDNEYIRWEDSLGETGWVPRNQFHTQSYWPEWITNDVMTFRGTRLAPNAVDKENGTNFILYSYPWGYADNYPNRFEAENSFDISWAVDSEGNKVHLPGIHFVKVQTGLHQRCGWLGESSTEICKARDLHY